MCVCVCLCLCVFLSVCLLMQCCGLLTPDVPKEALGDIKFAYVCVVLVCFPLKINKEYVFGFRK